VKQKFQFSERKELSTQNSTSNENSPQECMQNKDREEERKLREFIASDMD
jgi:hypothetical protein